MRKPAESLAIAAALLFLGLIIPAVIFAAGSWTLARSPTRAGAMWWSVRADSSPLVYLGGYVVYPLNSPVHFRNVVAVDKETGNVVWDLFYAGQGFGFNNFYGLTSDDTYLYAVGYEAATNNLPQLIIQKHEKATGRLIWTVRKDPTPFVDLYYRAYLYGGRLYVVGTTNGMYHDPSCPEDQEVADWIISAYDASTGTGLWDRTLSLSQCYDDEANGVYVDATGVYVAGFGNWPAAPASSAWIWAVARYSLDGTLLDLYRRPGGLGYGIVGDGQKLYVAGVRATGLEFHFQLDRMSPSPLQLEASDSLSAPSGYALPLHMALATGPRPAVLVVGAEADDLGWYSGQWHLGWRIEKRFIPSLQLDTAFGAGGILNLYSTDLLKNQGHDVSVDANGQSFYAAGCTSDTGAPPFGGCVVVAGPTDNQAWIRRDLATGR